jgi:hypothetical protein
MYGAFQKKFVFDRPFIRFEITNCSFGEQNWGPESSGMGKELQLKVQNLQLPSGILFTINPECITFV